MAETLQIWHQVRIGIIFRLICFLCCKFSAIDVSSYQFYWPILVTHQVKHGAVNVRV